MGTERFRVHLGSADEAGNRRCIRGRHRRPDGQLQHRLTQAVRHRQGLDPLWPRIFERDATVCPRLEVPPDLYALRAQDRPQVVSR